MAAPNGHGQADTQPASLQAMLAQAEQELRHGRQAAALALYDRAHQLAPGHCGIRVARRTLERRLNGQVSYTLGPPVCLTVIAARLHTLPRVVASLQRQTLPPRRIHIHVSEDPHLIDAGLDPGDPILQRLAAQPRVALHWVPNIGPYRKFAPFLSRAPQHPGGHPEPRGGDADPLDPHLFLTVDDDTLYPPRFIEYLVSKRRRYGCIVAHRGRRIRLSPAGDYAPYADWHDGLHEPRLANLPTGQSGVLYHRSDFPDDLQLEAALALAPTHDDLWLRWLTASQGVPAMILQPNAAARTAELAFPTADGSEPYAATSLWFAYNAASADPERGNDAAVQAIDAYFRAGGFDLAQRLRLEREEHADFY
jgi:hypothetical protein